MRIRIVADGRVFKGGPRQIVESMRRTDQVQYPSIRSYIEKCVERLNELYQEEIRRAEWQKDDCEWFLHLLLEKGYIRLESADDQCASDKREHDRAA